MMRVRVSTLEEFRWLTILDDAAREQDLIARVQGRPVPPNWKMERGTAWHKLIAEPALYGPADPDDRIWEGEYAFDLGTIDAARCYVGPGLFEVTGRRIFDLGRESIEVQGTCDWIRGLTLQDNKTRCEPPEPRDYEGSLQWRFYLLLHGAEVFRYNLWHFKDPDKNGYSLFREVSSVNFWRYPGLEQECREWLCRFLEWCDHHSLLPYLKRSAS